jgi:ADP-ribose pyrophosphatase YjhB (NUDIX family)
MKDILVDNDDLYYDERSAGGIVYRKIDGKIVWLVIKVLNKRMSNRSNEVVHKTVHKFPKGHLNPGEVLKQAAAREVEEEGVVKSQIISKIGSNDYIIWDKFNKKKIIKKVTFFLMEYTGDSDIRYSDREVVLKRDWFSLEDALAKLSYNSEKILLKKSAAKLDSLLKQEKSVK